MPLTKYHKIHFVDIAHPGETASAEPQQRRAAYSHAARTAHARTRNIRTTQYQAVKAAQLLQHTTGIRNNPKNHQSSAADDVDARLDAELAPILPTPLDYLATNQKDPFTAFAAPFNAFDRFLFDHYVNCVIPYLNTSCSKLKQGGLYVDRNVKGWIRLVLAHEGLLSGVFLTASRHLSQLYCDQHRQQNFAQLAIRYKLACVRNLRETISDTENKRMLNDPVVAQVMLLTLDEISQGDLTMAQNHMRGAVKIVDLNGGPQRLGLDGFLELLFHKFLSQAGLTAILPLEKT